MAYEYLNNVWSDQNAVKGFGDALNNNLASLVELRSRQQQNDRANALNAAYLALERQKLSMQQPNIDSEIANRSAMTAEANARAQGLQSSNNYMTQQQQMGEQLAAAVMRRMTAPQQQPMPMQGGPQGVPPTMMPMTPTANNLIQLSPQPQQQQMPGYPMGAPSLQNGQMVDRAYIQSILARQAAMQPGGALRMMQGNVLQPGETQFNMLTGQKENSVPYQLTPQQIMTDAIQRQRLGMQDTKLDLDSSRLDELMRHNKVMEENSVDPIRAALKQSDSDTSAPSSGYTAPNTPKLGEVRQGYRYKGGNPGDPSSWEGVTNNPSTNSPARPVIPVTQNIKQPASALVAPNIPSTYPINPTSSANPTSLPRPAMGQSNQAVIDQQRRAAMVQLIMQQLQQQGAIRPMADYEGAGRTNPEDYAPYGLDGRPHYAQ